MPLHQTRNLPSVAIVGRTNVGKSTLWNRLTESGRAIISADLHTTRDRNYGLVKWKGQMFEIVDTGGMDTEDDSIGVGIRKQAERAIKDADLVLFVIDGRDGVLVQDFQLAREVKKLSNKNLRLVANKIDNTKFLSGASEPDIYKLGLGDAIAVSATTSLGIGDLLEDILTNLERVGKPAPSYELDEKGMSIVMVGRPNVGKSSLVNRILGEERVIVSPIPHTTREPQDTKIHYQDRDITIVDTAGMRKRSKIDTGIEEDSIERNEKAIERADVALLVFDATQDPTVQDRHLAGMLEESSKGLVLVANKWDLVKDKETDTSIRYEALIRQLFPFLSWAPMIFVSALEGTRATKLLDMAIEINNERDRHIDYNAVNRVLKYCIQKMKPLASYGPKSPRIYDVAQVGHRPPEFLITVHGEKDNLHPNWLRFFEKRLREKFKFTGTPIVVKVRHLPVAKSNKPRNIHGPGMEAAVGKIKEKKKLVNQTMRRQKHGGRRY